MKNETEHIKPNVEIVNFNPQELTKTIEEVKHSNLKKYLDLETIKTRLQEITSPKDRMLILFLFLSGVRITEALELRKKDINFSDGFMLIRWQKSRKYYERLIPVHDKLREVLYIYSSPLKAEDRIFSFTRQRAEQITKKWLGVSPHKLRHSFAVNFIKQSHSPGALRILQKLLGHSHINTTMTYLDYVPVDQQTELNKIQF